MTILGILKMKKQTTVDIYSADKDCVDQWKFPIPVFADRYIMQVAHTIGYVPNSDMWVVGVTDDKTAIIEHDPKVHVSGFIYAGRKEMPDGLEIGGVILSNYETPCRLRGDDCVVVPVEYIGKGAVKGKPHDLELGQKLSAQWEGDDGDNVLLMGRSDIIDLIRSSNAYIQIIHTSNVSSVKLTCVGLGEDWQYREDVDMILRVNQKVPTYSRLVTDQDVIDKAMAAWSSHSYYSSRYAGYSDIGQLTNYSVEFLDTLDVPNGRYNICVGEGSHTVSITTNRDALPENLR